MDGIHNGKQYDYTNAEDHIEHLENNTNDRIQTHMDKLAEELEIKLSQHSLNLIREGLTNDQSKE